MNKRQRREKKNQQRKQIAKERVQARREKIRADAKKDYQMGLLERKYGPKRRPYMKREQPVDLGVSEEEVEQAQSGMFDHTKTFAQIKDDMVKQKLKKNMELLKALEEEFAQEQKQREELNAELGDISLREKMDIVAQKVEAENLEKEAD